MLKEGTKRTIEHYLMAAQAVLERAGISTIAQGGGDKPHGFVLLQYFDYSTKTLRFYRHRFGASPFRNFVRLGPSHPEHFSQLARLVEALRRLQDQFERHFPHIDCNFEPADEAFIRRVNLEDIVPWPDEVFYGVPQSAQILRALTLGKRPILQDLHKDFFSEYNNMPSDTLQETNALGAIELVYLGPWCGFPVGCIEKALKQFYDELHNGTTVPTSPMAHCLEPGNSWRWRQPLWQAGRIEGLLTVLLGGSLDGYDNLDETCFEEMSEIGDLIRSVLERERERKAEEALEQWKRDGTGSFETALADYCRTLLSPHEITDFRVTEPNEVKTRDNGMRHDTLVGGNGAGNRFQVKDHILGKDITVDVELYEEQRPNICELVKIYFAGELRRIGTVLSESVDTVSLTSGGPEGVRLSVTDQAAELLERYKGEKLSTKDYCLCFICLAILSKPNEYRIQITGNSKITLQRDLLNVWSISRKNQWDRNGTLRLDDGGEPLVMPLSQLCDDRAINFVREQLPNIAITRYPRDLVVIEFGGGA